MQYGTQIQCPICGNEAFRDDALVFCSQCKIEYNIGENRWDPPVFTEEQKTVLKTYITRFYDKNCGKVPIIKEDTYKDILGSPYLKYGLPKIFPDFDWILQDFKRSTKEFGTVIEIFKIVSNPNSNPNLRDNPNYRWYFCKSENEFEYVLETLQKDGYIECQKTENGWNVSLTRKGYEKF